MMEKKIKAINTIDLDFESIRGEVRENLEQTFAEARARRQRKLPYMRAIRAVCIALCICTAAAVLIIEVTNSNLSFNNNSPGSIAPVKHSTSYFNTSFFAYGPASSRELFSIDIILNSNIISESDKAVLQRDYTGKKDSYYNVYMGLRNGEDVIKICLLSTPKDNIYKPAPVFKSTLNYRFEDIIKEFERQSGTELTDEFLRGHEFKYDSNQAIVETMGILMNFKDVDGVYVPYYHATINGKEYIVENIEN